MKIIKSLYAVASLILVLPFFCAGQPAHDRQADKNKKDAQEPNGISAGRPKVFDNRTLTLMLEALSDQLRNLQIVDQKTLSAALGLQQGFSSTDFSSNLTASTLPIPGFKQETVAKTGNVDSSGKVLPDTTQKTASASRDVVTPQIPSLDTAPGLTGFNPNYGESAGDLLSDQVNLSYQIFNLRMILERSLSDRLLNSNKPRLQAVLGVNVTLDPPRTANDAVAVVEITVEVENPAEPDGLSLVSLMPQEKTYNTAAVSTKSNAFGGSAVVKMVQVSYNQRRRSQMFYLYRDTDTLAYERINKNEPNKLVFGWMFRPVLGRRSVASGLRQVFAILALPAEDHPSLSGANGVAPLSAQRLKASLRTYWKKYDRGTSTSFEQRDANRAKRFGFGLSAGLNKPEIFEGRYENEADYENIEVKSTADYEQALRAEIDEVYWRPVGTKTALVSVKGKNFFTDTKVTVGDKVYANPADGFILKSAQSFDLATTLDALAAGPGAVISRYGRAVPLYGTVPENLPPNGVVIRGVKSQPTLAGYRTLDIYLKTLSSEKKYVSLQLGQLPRDHVWDGEKTDGRLGPAALPIITVNNNVVPLPYSIVETAEGLILQANVPDSYMPNGGGVLKVSWPFLPPDKWTSTWHMADPKLEFEVIRLTNKTIFITRKDPLGFTKDPDSSRADGTPAKAYCWQLLAGDKAIQLFTSVCATGMKGPIDSSDNSVSAKLDADIPDKIILMAPNLATYQLDVPKLKPNDSETPKPIALKQYDSAWIEIAGKDFSAAVSAEADGLSLKVRKAKSTKEGEPVTKIEVEITRQVTARPGDVEITILDKDGKLLGNAHVQVVCLHCGDGGK